MGDLKRLLAATDLSSSSLHAIERGFIIAQATGASYTIVHALGMDGMGALRELLGTGVPGFALRLEAETREALQRVASEPAVNRGAAAAIEVVSGIAHAAIPRLAEAMHADLVLVGAHGRGFLQRILLGSTASRVLRRSRCPVLVVKEPGRAPYRRALVAVDFSQGSERCVRAARAVAPGAEIVLLHACEVPFEGKLHWAGVNEGAIEYYRSEVRMQATQRLVELARVAGIADAGGSRHRVVVGDAARRILLHEEESDCDLVVVGKHGTHVTEELLLGSVTSRILAESRSDVLVTVDEQQSGDRTAHS